MRLLKKANFKKLLILIALLVFGIAAFGGGAFANRLFPKQISSLEATLTQKIITEETAIEAVAEKISPSVVTVAVVAPKQRIMQFSPFGGFESRVQGGEPQDIGSGFIVDSSGLIITNKHVVEDTGGTYKVITHDDKEYDAKQIFRDPYNDIAIIKIEATGLIPVTLGDSSNLKVGQYAIAIGTALGEFRHTVTTGVISGLGRGITAGSAYQGYVEQIDNVIQTDAAINPGNSGGPLLDAAGSVIGVNVAVASGAQNIGFAIPINVVKEGLKQFNETGNFAQKPFLGVQYQMIPKQTALLNNVPQGAYVTDVVSDSPASKAGIQIEDIITKFDGVELNEDSEKTLSDLIAAKKVGESVTVTIWRNDEIKDITAILQASNQQ
jgi:S1-C subfamily serine protease